MNKGNNFTDIGTRLEQLRKEKKIAIDSKGKEVKLTQPNLCDLLGIPSDRQYRNYLNGTSQLDAYTLCKFADFYQVSVDYILCRSDFKSIGNEELNNLTGLSDDSIENIKAIRLRGAQDDYMNCVVTDMFTGGMIRKTPRFIVTNTLNKLLSSPYFESILYAVDDFINTHYNIPVHYEKTTPHNKPGWYENNQQIYNGSDMCMSFACDKSNLSDTRDMVVSDTFLESVALKDIEKALYEIKKGCP